MVLCFEVGGYSSFFKKPAYLLRIAAATTTTRCQETKPWLCAGGCCFEFNNNCFELCELIIFLFYQLKGDARSVLIKGPTHTDYLERGKNLNFSIMPLRPHVETE